MPFGIGAAARSSSSSRVVEVRDELQFGPCSELLRAKKKKKRRRDELVLYAYKLAHSKHQKETQQSIGLALGLVVCSSY
jgi:hypothetical protein